MQHIDTEIAVIGASLGGVMAAWQACRAGKRVVLTSAYPWMGGQMSAQAVPPDEHGRIESGGASESYLAFRAAIRTHYLNDKNFTDHTALTEGCNPGDGWVSRLCFEPALAADYFEQLLAPFVASGVLTILRGLAPREATRLGRLVTQVRCTDQAAASVEIKARYFLDATDTGELIRLAGLAYRLGKEARDTFNEPHAPQVASRDDQQPVTFVMALRAEAQAGAPSMAPPAFAFWRDYTLRHFGHPLFSEHYPSHGHTSISLPFIAEGPALDWWRYRRVVSAQNWRGRGAAGKAEVTLVNWPQNDYALHPLLDGGVSEQCVEAGAKSLSLAFLHWLQTAAPRPDGTCAGYPHWQLAPDIVGTTDGFAQQVYVRESRRIVGLATLTENALLADADNLAPRRVADSVGIGWYNMDIHPTCISGDSVNARARPFEIALGTLIAKDCDNLIPACKNLSVSHLANAATRVHPIEWLIGESAGVLAAFAHSSTRSPAQIHADVTSVRALQAQLHVAGVPTTWPTALLEPRHEGPPHERT